VVTLIKRAERAVPPVVDAPVASSTTDDFASSAEGSDGEDAEALTSGAIDWGVSLGGELGADVPYMDEDGTGPAMDLTAGPGEGAEPDEIAEPVPALASTGGRWRSRSAG
jgi:hypothetical protein